MLRQTLAGIALLAVASVAISADTPIQQVSFLQDCGAPLGAACASGAPCGDECAAQCAVPCETQCDTHWAEVAGERCTAFLGGECADQCCDTLWAEKAGEQCAALLDASGGCCATDGNCCKTGSDCQTGTCCVPSFSNWSAGLSTKGTWKSDDDWLTASQSQANNGSNNSRDLDDYRKSLRDSMNGSGSGCPCRNCCLSNLALYPDKGWAPPACTSLNRSGIWYQTMVRDQLYGSPGGGYQARYPMVYQPTDTTQLGYTYHQVPTWQPRPGSIPIPIPSMYHNRACPGAANGCQVCAAGGSHVIQSEYVITAPQPAQSSATVQASPVAPSQAAQVFRQTSSSRPVAGNRPQDARPASASRRSNGFRLTDLKGLFR